MTIYYETARDGLIPCEFLGYAKSPAHAATGCYNVVIRMKRTKGSYQCGEILHTPAWTVVEKAGMSDYYQLVRTAALPARTDENTRAARV